MDKMLQIFEPGTGHENMLCCTGCESEYIAHNKVIVSERNEDKKTGLRVAVCGDETIEVDTDAVKDNPSSRRHGLIVRFVCEMCDHISVLEILQHKGCTYVNIK